MQYFWMDGIKTFDGPYHDIEEAVAYARGMKSFASPEHMYIFLATFDPESGVLDLYRDESDRVVTWGYLVLGGSGPVDKPKQVTREAAAVSVSSHQRAQTVLLHSAPQLTNVHTSHCCVNHGCKYGDKDCDVVKGRLKQEYNCSPACGDF